MRSRIFVCVVVVLTLSACTTLLDKPRSPYPAFRTRTNSELIDKAGIQVLQPLNFDSAHKVLIGLTVLYDDARYGRQMNATIANELLYYGTLTAVLGVTLDSRAARNTGAAVAAAGDLFNSHYRTAEQQAVFEKAYARTKCGEDAIVPLTDEVLASFGADGLANAQPGLDDKQRAAGVKDAQTALDQLPDDTQTFINQVQADLATALRGLPITTDKDALSKTVGTYNTAREAKAPTDTPAKKKVQEAEQRVDLLQEQLKNSETTRGEKIKALGLRYDDFDNPDIVPFTQEVNGQSKSLDDAKKYLIAAKATEAKDASAQRAFVMALYAYKPALDVCLKLPQ